MFAHFARADVTRCHARLITTLTAGRRIQVTLTRVHGNFVADFDVTRDGTRTMIIFFAGNNVQSTLFARVTTRTVSVLFLRFTGHNIRVRFRRRIGTTARIGTRLRQLDIGDYRPTQHYQNGIGHRSMFIARGTRWYFADTRLNIDKIRTHGGDTLFRYRELDDCFFFLWHFLSLSRHLLANNSSTHADSLGDQVLAGRIKGHVRRASSGRRSRRSMLPREVAIWRNGSLERGFWLRHLRNTFQRSNDCRIAFGGCFDNIVRHSDGMTIFHCFNCTAGRTAIHRGFVAFNGKIRRLFIFFNTLLL